MSTEKPLTSATETSRRPERRSWRSRWVALSLKRKILLLLIAWGIIEEVVSWIFKARGIDVGPLGVFSLMGTFISGF